MMVGTQSVQFPTYIVSDGGNPVCQVSYIYCVSDGGNSVCQVQVYIIYNIVSDGGNPVCQVSTCIHCE